MSTEPSCETLTQPCSLSTTVGQAAQTGALACLMGFVAALMVVFTPSIDSATAGFVLSLSLSFVGTLTTFPNHLELCKTDGFVTTAQFSEVAWLVQRFPAIQMNFSSVERIGECLSICPSCLKCYSCG